MTIRIEFLLKIRLKPQVTRCAQTISMPARRICFLKPASRLLWKPLGLIWTNVVEKKMYLTGGCGALWDGASPDGAKDQKTITRVHQAYGRNFQLPNVTAYCETCANIGNVLWNWRMFLATGDAKYMDVIELTLDNSVLSGGGLDGTDYFYVNPLRQLNTMPTKLRWPRVRVPFLSSFLLSAQPGSNHCGVGRLCLRKVRRCDLGQSLRWQRA